MAHRVAHGLAHGPRARFCPYPDHLLNLRKAYIDLLLLNHPKPSSFSAWFVTVFEKCLRIPVHASNRQFSSAVVVPQSKFTELCSSAAVASQSKSTDLCNLVAVVPQSKSTEMWSKFIELCSSAAPFDQDLWYFWHRKNVNTLTLCYLLRKTYKAVHSSATLESLKSTRSTKLLETLSEITVFTEYGAVSRLVRSSQTMFTVLGLLISLLNIQICCGCIGMMLKETNCYIFFRR